MRANSAMPTLMFHGIHSRYIPAGSYTAGERFYAISDVQLVEILSSVREAGLCSVIPPTSSPHQSQGTTVTDQVCITFDDSHLSHYISALPILADLRMRAIFFITVGQVSRKGRLSWRQVRALSNEGMMVQSHTVSHRPLDRLADREVIRELSDSRRMLEDEIGREVTMLSLPGGRGGRRVERLAREAGFNRIFGSGHGGRGQIRRHAVTACDPQDGCMRYLFPTRLSAARQIMLSATAAAAKDILGERLYEFAKTGHLSRALRQQSE